jgi:hypothetical protein
MAHLSENERVEVLIELGSMLNRMQKYGKLIDIVILDIVILIH